MQRYGEGIGVARDTVAAYVWLSIAAEQVDLDAALQPAALATTLKPAELAIAKTQLERCRSSALADCDPPLPASATTTAAP